MSSSPTNENEPSSPPSSGGPAGGDKKPNKKQEKEEAKRKAQAEKEAQALAKMKEAEELIKEKFGTLPIVQSAAYASKKYTEVQQLNKSLEGQTVLVRGRVQTVRAKGKLAFVVLRSTPYTVQCVLQENDAAGIPREAIQWLGRVRPESVVDVKAKVAVPPVAIQTVTQQDAELQIESMFIVSSVIPLELPFQLEDAGRREFTEAEIKALEEKAASEGKKGALTIGVAIDNRLNCRWLDLRTKANHAIFHLQHRVGALFRENLEANGFVEIHSPKIISTASEGGANVFKVKYFDRETYLAQSPQLYKQMALMADFHRVYEIGPVFRAENSNTHRHLTEFVGLDLEMTIKEHYYEILDVAEEMFVHIFHGLSTKYRTYLDMVREQYPFEDLVFQVPPEKINELGMGVIEEAGSVQNAKDPGKVRNRNIRVLRIPYPAGALMINEKLKELRPLTRQELNEQYGIKTKNDYEKEQCLKDMGMTDDLSTQNEKLLGRVVKQKYGVDFFIMDRYPSPVRPFYTMPCQDDPNYTNSYDIFIRGEEIVSGAQRIHDAEMLLARAKTLGVDLTPIKDYVDSFRLGAFPHGGFGVGLERVVMLFLGLGNIRLASLFPRDPTRTTP